jgi:hypothetical protein
MLKNLHYHAAEMLRSNEDSPTRHCKICSAESALFDVLDFGKACGGNIPRYLEGIQMVPVYYYICSKCHFIYTTFFDNFSPDDWNKFVYNDQYILVDPDFETTRPIANAEFIESMFYGRRKDVLGLDFGGGNGLTATLLTKRGWAYDCLDPFGHNNIREERIGHYNVCSAFEVFEHLCDPKSALKFIVETASPGKLIVLIGTSVHDGLVTPTSRLSWPYVAPRNGHISIFSRDSLRALGANLGMTYTSVSRSTHLLTRGVSTSGAFRLLVGAKVVKTVRSLIKRN